MTAILSEIVGLLTGGITNFATGIGSGIQALVTNLFLTGGETQALSVFGGLVIIFAGISLTINLSVKLFNWLSGFGN